jgi:hypothetical protein
MPEKEGTRRNHACASHKFRQRHNSADSGPRGSVCDCRLSSLSPVAFMKPSSGSQSESRNRWSLRQGIRGGECGVGKATSVRPSIVGETERDGDRTAAKFGFTRQWWEPNRRLGWTQTKWFLKKRCPRKKSRKTCLENNRSGKNCSERATTKLARNQPRRHERQEVCRNFWCGNHANTVSGSKRPMLKRRGAKLPRSTTQTGRRPGVALK